MNQKPLRLSIEFVQRYYLFIKDGKNHFQAIQLTKDEFKFKIIKHSNDCYFFTDNSAADYVFGDWQIA